MRGANPRQGIHHSQSYATPYRVVGKSVAANIYRYGTPNGVQFITNAKVMLNCLRTILLVRHRTAVDNIVVPS